MRINLGADPEPPAETGSLHSRSGGQRDQDENEFFCPITHVRPSSPPDPVQMYAAVWLQASLSTVHAACSSLNTFVCPIAHVRLASHPGPALRHSAVCRSAAPESDCCMLHAAWWCSCLGASWSQGFRLMQTWTPLSLTEVGNAGACLRHAVIAPLLCMLCLPAAQQSQPGWSCRLLHTYRILGIELVASMH